MRSRLKVLQRLASLHDVVEQTHAVALERRAADVREAEQAIDLQQATAQTAAFDGRAALILDDKVGRSLAEMQWELARWRRVRLERVRAEREELRAAAHEQYIASRVKSEQMRSVTESVAAQIAIDEGRRIQAATDDRYLSRRLWTETQRSRDRAGINES
jgi:hypothetical protein